MAIQTIRDTSFAGEGFRNDQLPLGPELAEPDWSIPLLSDQLAELEGRDETSAEHVQNFLNRTLHKNPEFYPQVTAELAVLVALLYVGLPETGARISRVQTDNEQEQLRYLSYSSLGFSRVARSYGESGTLFAANRSPFLPRITVYEHVMHGHAVANHDTVILRAAVEEPAEELHAQPIYLDWDPFQAPADPLPPETLP